MDILSFLILPFLAGVLMSITTSSVGCILVWRRMSFFGEALAHSAILGVALSLIFQGLPIFVGVMAVGILVGLVLINVARQSNIGADTVLAIMASGCLALGMVCLGKLTVKPVDPSGYLFGDILTVNQADILFILISAAAVIIFIVSYWHSLLLITLNADLARAEGINVARIESAFIVVVALAIASCLKIIGALLLPAMLVMPQATAASYAKTPFRMMVYCFVFTSISIGGGLLLSVHLNTPSGGMIVITSLGIFLISQLQKKITRR